MISDSGLIISSESVMKSRDSRTQVVFCDEEVGQRTGSLDFSCFSSEKAWISHQKHQQNFEIELSAEISFADFKIFVE